MPTLPRLIVFAGLPGVGKSEIAEQVARQLGATRLRVDTVEAALLKAGIPRSFETGLAAYVVARDLAEEHLRSGQDVVVDAVNGVEPARQAWRELARTCPAELHVVEVVCPDREEHRRRVERRPRATPPLPNPTWAEVLAREYLPWPEKVLSLDGTKPPRSNAKRVVDALAAGGRGRADAPRRPS